MAAAADGAVAPVAGGRCRAARRRGAAAAREASGAGRLGQRRRLGPARAPDGLRGPRRRWDGGGQVSRPDSSRGRLDMSDGGADMSGGARGAELGLGWNSSANFGGGHLFIDRGS